MSFFDLFLQLRHFLVKMKITMLSLVFEMTSVITSVCILLTIADIESHYMNTGGSIGRNGQLQDGF